MIERLYVDNFRCLVNFEIQLGELALLVGRNGNGKTSVLDVVYAVRSLLFGQAKVTDHDAFPVNSLTRWQDRPRQVVEMEVDLGDEHTHVYRLEVEHEPGLRKARVAVERLTLGGKPLFEFESGDVRLYRDDHSAGPEFSADWSESALARVPARKDNKKLTRFLDFVRKIQVCGLYPRGFSAESRSEDPLLLRDGANFASWYRHVLQERQDLMPGYQQAVGEVIDGLKGIRLERVGSESRDMIVVIEEHGRRYELKLDEVSDGQRALLLLYALVHITAGQGYSLFLDEPDNYVALAEIQPWLMTLADACGEAFSQAVICSHHPELIDYLGAEHGLLLERGNSGLVTTRPLGKLAETGGLKLSETVARGWER